MDRRSAWVNVDLLAGKVVTVRAGERFDWSQTYGPLNWPRTGTLVFQVQASYPDYWKTEDLDTFNGQAWTSAPVGLGDLYALQNTVPPANLKRWHEQLKVTLRAIKRERGAGRDGAGAGQTALPLALREAPGPVDGDGGVGELLGGLVAPVRSGLILTRRAVAAGAGQVGAGHRIGERRFALRAMLESEPDRTAGWLAQEAARWSRRHLGIAAGDPVQRWWADRAAATARVLRGQSGATRAARVRRGAT